MPRTQTGLERARELRRIRDEWDSRAEKQVESLQHAVENVEQAAHTFARYRVIGDLMGDLLAEESRVLLAKQEEDYTALTVDAEIGSDVLTRLNAARDAVRGELASVVHGLTMAERRAFERI